MKRMQCKFLPLFLLFLCIGFIISRRQVFAVTDKPSRQINLVYDDSGSMISYNGDKVDTWCRAKYSMEVFAAMLGEKDQLHIYTMSDYVEDTKAAPRYKLAGNKGAKANVAEIHSMLTNAGNTPFNAVRKAAADLKKSNADEKWLVILTDGEFDDFRKKNKNKQSGAEKNPDEFFAKKDKDVNVMFFGMGSEAAEIREDPSRNIYCEKAMTSGEILSKVTTICSRIFNNDKLPPIDKTQKKLSFDVPMSQLIVFAQGKDVTIRGLKDSSGKTFTPSVDPVTVQFSEQATSNTSKRYADPKVDRNLKGSVCTLQGDFPAGEYTLDVDGADTVEVYYSPNVDIRVMLKNSKGENVTSIEEIETGDYEIDFGFVKAGTNETVKESELLGDIKYDAVVTNNGKKHDKEYHSGDIIHLEEGELQIDVTATFLKYNSVTSSQKYTIFKNKPIGLSINKDPVYYVLSKGLSSDGSKKAEPEPVTLRLTLDGRDFTKEEWDQLDTITASIDRSSSQKKSEGGGLFGFFQRVRTFNTIDEIEVIKTKDPGIVQLMPKINEVRGGTYVDTDYQLQAYSQKGKSVWKGELKDRIKVEDKRNILEREGKTIFRLVISALLLLLLLGFTPLFKKRFPKSMKASPTINCRPLPYGKKTQAHGRFKKDTASTLLPFVAEKGSLRFVPSGTVGMPAMKLKAGGGSKLIILNTKAFAGKKNFYIDSQQVEKDTTRLLQKAPTMQIEVKTDVMHYTCVPRN